MHEACPSGVQASLLPTLLSGRYRIELRGPCRASSLGSAVSNRTGLAETTDDASARTCDLLGVKNARKYPISVIFA